MTRNPRFLKRNRIYLFYVNCRKPIKVKFLGLEGTDVLTYKFVDSNNEPVKVPSIDLLEEF